MRKFIFRIFPKFSPFPKTFLGNSPIFPIPLRKKFFGEMEALDPRGMNFFAQEMNFPFFYVVKTVKFSS